MSGRKHVQVIYDARRLAVGGALAGRLDLVGRVVAAVRQTNPAPIRTMK